MCVGTRARAKQMKQTGGKEQTKGSEKERGDEKKKEGWVTERLGRFRCCAHDGNHVHTQIDWVQARMDTHGQDKFDEREKTTIKIEIMRQAAGRSFSDADDGRAWGRGLERSR